MRVLVTGAGGFVGAACVDAAGKFGHSVMAVTRPSGRPVRLAQPDIEVAAVDLLDSDEVDRVVHSYRPDVLVHAAWSGVNNANRNDYRHASQNIASAVNLASACIASGSVAKIIAIGSQGEYGLLEGKISEAATPKPTSLYGATKVAAELLMRQMCSDAGIGFAWLRLFSTYGPNDNPNWLIPSLVNQMLDGKRPRTTDGVQLWDYLHIDDVASAVIAVAESKQATGIFNLGSGRPVSVRSIVEIIRDLASPDLELVFGEIPYGQNQIWHMEADIGRLTALSGFAPQIELREGLRQTVEWHRAQRQPSMMS